MIYMISSPIIIPPMACSMLNSDYGFVFVFARVVRHCLWYRASRAVISPIAYFANNTWFSSHAAISHTLLSDWIVLDLDTLPSNLSQMKHVFNGAIDMANLNNVLHWLWHFHMSHCAYVYLLFPGLGASYQVVCHDAEWFLNTLSMPSPSFNWYGSMSTGCGEI